MNNFAYRFPILFTAEGGDPQGGGTASDAVKKAMDKVDKKMGLEEKTEEKTEEKEDKSEKKEEKEEEKEEVDEETERARLIYQALNDPEKAPAFIQFLAKQVGFEVNPAKSEKENAKTLSQEVAEAMGEDFKYFGPKLGAAIEKVVGPFIQKAIEDGTKDLKKEIETERNERKEKRIQSAMDEVFDSYKEVDDKFLKSVNDMMSEMPPSPKSDPVKYFERIVQIVAKEKGITLTKIGKADKTLTNEEQNQRRLNNRSDANSRLASKGGTPSGKEGREESPKNLDESIRRGMRKADELFSTVRR